MKAEKEILSVTVQKPCHKTLPCKHTIKLQYTDQTEEQTGLLSATAIVEKYHNYLNEKDKKHFSSLIESSIFNHLKPREQDASYHESHILGQI